MNAKVGSDNTGREQVMGKEGIGNINENGELFSDFCAHNDMVIGGTLFRHRNIHKTTWISPDTQTKNQIDHITIARRWRKTLRDVRVYRGADIGSDHELVVAKVKIKIAKAKKNSEQMHKRFNVTKLAHGNIREEFTISLQNRFQALSGMDENSVESKWSRVKKCFADTCEEQLGYNKKA